MEPCKIKISKYNEIKQQSSLPHVWVLEYIYSVVWYMKVWICLCNAWEHCISSNVIEGKLNIFGCDTRKMDILECNMWKNGNIWNIYKRKCTVFLNLMYDKNLC